MFRRLTLVPVCALALCGLVWAGTKANSRPGVHGRGGNGGREVNASSADPAAHLQGAEASHRDFDILRNRIEIPARTSVEDGSRPIQSTVEAVTAVRLESGETIPAGQLVPAGSVIVRGIVRNTAVTSIELRNFDSNEVVVVQDGGMVVIAALSSCSVSCSSNSACCKVVQGNAECQCTTTPTNCQAGGSGATACGIATSN